MIAVEAIRDDFIELTSFFWSFKLSLAFGRRLPPKAAWRTHIAATSAGGRRLRGAWANIGRIGVSVSTLRPSCSKATRFIAEP